MLGIIARVVGAFLLAVFTGSFFASACLADEVISEENKWGSPVDGGRILFGSIGEASNLIPYLTADSASHEVADLIYVAPLRYNKDLQVEPWAVESWSMEDEGRLMRFTLRKGILWEDGVELTTADVAYTCKVVADPATGSPYAEDFSRIKDFRIIDRYTFEVEYEHFFARSVSTWMQPILPRHLLEGQNIRNTPFSRRPVGAGPYRLKSWEPGSRIILEASPSYFAGKPHINEVVYRIIPDNATMFMETRAGRLDVMGPVSYTHLDVYKRQVFQYFPIEVLLFKVAQYGLNVLILHIDDQKAEDIVQVPLQLAAHNGKIDAKGPCHLRDDALLRDDAREHEPDVGAAGNERVLILHNGLHVLGGRKKKVFGLAHGHGFAAVE